MSFLCKITTKTVSLMLAVFASLPSSADENMQLGFYEGNSVTFIQVKEGATGGSALYFPATTMQAYAGCEITDINVSFFNRSDETEVKVFITTSLDAEPLYQQDVKGVSRGWNKITLDTPFEIDGSAVYIGYEMTGQYYLSYSNAFIDGEEYILQGDGGWNEYTNIYSASLYATVTGGNLPRNNVSIGHITLPGYTLTGEPLAASGEFSNLGLDNVDRLTVTYMVDGEAAGEETVDVESTAYRTEGTFNLNGISLNTTGEKNVQLVLSAVNGKADADPSDNTSEARSIMALDEFVQRNVLFEVFSTELCSNCPNAHEAIHRAFGDKENVIEIGHHAGYYQDGFTIDESKEYEWFYPPTRLYAPAMMLDRTSFADNLPTLYTDESPVAGIGEAYLRAAYNEANSVPAMAEVNIRHNLDREARRLEVTVDGKTLIQQNRTDKPRLYVFLTEDSVFSTTQSGATGSFYHRHVARRSLTPTWGDEIDTDNGFSASYTADLPEEWDMGMLRVVAFVAYYAPDDRLRCNVLNSAVARIAPDLASGISVTEAGGGMAEASFDGESIITPGGNDGVTVLDMSGRTVMDVRNGGTSTSLKGLQHGIYIVKVKTGNSFETIKISL